MPLFAGDHDSGSGGVREAIGAVIHLRTKTMTIMDREDESRLMVFMFAIVICYCWSRWSPRRMPRPFCRSGFIKAGIIKRRTPPLAISFKVPKVNLPSVGPALGA